MRPLALSGFGLLSWLVATGPAPSEDSEGARLRFETLAGWADDDHRAAFSSFRAGCTQLSITGAAAQGARPPPEGLVELCRRASRLPDAGRDEARRFFEASFEPVEVSVSGFLTGYYEPELLGSLERSDAFPVPLLAPPDDLVPLPDGAGPTPDLEGLTAARRSPTGLEPYPDRAAIEAGALGAAASAVVHLADPVDAFMVHVQGSARIRLADGRAIRVGFAGRNGHRYTSVGRELARELDRPPAELTADRVVAWLKAHPQRAAEIMNRNRSYIFFRRLPESGEGPIGAAGVALTPGRSLAVDRAHWAYGTPVWLDGALPRPDGGLESLRRLVVAQDTGAAIVGPARADLFFGSGAEAGARASLVRHPVRVVSLVPRSEGPPP